MQTATNKDHGLSHDELGIIFNTLMPYDDVMAWVGLFGSRACGQFQPYSDIDLVIYGDLKEADVARINTLLDDSNLGLKVDVLAYKHIHYAPLKRHVDNTVKQLLSPLEIKSRHEP